MVFIATPSRLEDKIYEVTLDCIIDLGNDGICIPYYTDERKNYFFGEISTFKYAPLFLKDFLLKHFPSKNYEIGFRNIPKAQQNKVMSYLNSSNGSSCDSKVPSVT